jgi:RNA polymerase sigma factor (sigma-70 family)
VATPVEASDIIELYRLVRSESQRQLRSESSAEIDDVAHQCFLRIWRSFATPSLSMELPRPISRAYVRQTVRSVVVDRHRQGARLVFDEPELIDMPDAPDASDVIDRLDAISRLREIWQGMDELDRELLRLLYIENVSQEGAAKKLGISWGSLRVRLSRLREKIT